jgi:deoxyribonuclease-4
MAFDRATALGCTTFQLFTRNPRGWAFKPLTEEQVSGFLTKRRNSSFRMLLDHMPYLPNLASSDKTIVKKSRDALNAEVKRCDQLGIECLVVHLGSHGGKGVVVGMRNIAEAARRALDGSKGTTTILLENMAGQKNCVGARFEELRGILDLVDQPRRMGVCLDTCHAFAAGFDLASEAAVERSMGIFDDAVGLKELRAVHLNDSKGVLGSRLDRHEHIGMGKIGKAGFRAFLRWRGIVQRPIIMETPVDDLRSQEEDLALVRSLLPDKKS